MAGSTPADAASLENYLLCPTVQVARLAVDSPLRLAYDNVTKTVAVASMSLQDAMSARTASLPSHSVLYSFNATTRQLRTRIAVTTSRGVVDMEGLSARNGFILSGGFNSQVSLTLFAYALIGVHDSFGKTIIRQPRGSVHKALWPKP